MLRLRKNLKGPKKTVCSGVWHHYNDLQFKIKTDCFCIINLFIRLIDKWAEQGIQPFLSRNAIKAPCA